MNLTRKKAIEYLFDSTVFIFMFAEVLASSQVYYVSNVVFSLLGIAIKCSRLMLMLLFLLQSKRVSDSVVISLFAFMIAFLLSFFKVSIWAFYDLFFVSVFLTKCPIKKYYRVLQYSIISAIGLIFLMSILNMLPTVNFTRNGNQIRYAFGFSHPNTFSRYILILALLFVLERKEKIGYKDCLMLFLAALFVYYYPNSNTVAVLLLLLSLALLFNCITNGKLIWYSWFRAACCALIPVMIAVFIYGTWYFMQHPNLLFRTDNTIESRFVLGVRGLKMYDINLFGNDIEFVTSSSAQNVGSKGYFVLDSLFYYLPLRMGVVITLMFIMFYYRAIFVGLQRNYFYHLLALMIIAVYSFFESAIMTSSAYVFSFLFIEMFRKETMDIKKLFNLMKVANYVKK